VNKKSFEIPDDDDAAEKVRDERSGGDQDKISNIKHLSYNIFLVLVIIKSHHVFALTEY